MIFTTINGGKEYELSGIKTEDIKEIVIPPTYRGLPVTSIGSSAFYGCKGLEIVTIPNSITSIGKYAFEGCTGLTSITIPDSVTSIGSDAFYDCTGLTSITIPDSVTSIGNNAFDGCTGLTSITIPDSVTSIGSGAFYGCTGLTSINVDSSNPNYSSQDGVLLNKEKTELVKYPTGNETASYEIPSTVTSIGNSAFYGCTGLTSITIPNSVTSIGANAFGTYSSLKDVYYSGTESEWLAISIGSSNNKLTESIIHTSTGDIVLKFTAINDGKEYGVSGIKQNAPKEIIIPSTYNGLPVTSIGNSAFNGCKGLISITIPNSVTSIGNSAFNGCTGLTSITIPNSVTSIGNSAFSGCAKLASIVIPGSVSSIGSSAFSDCTGLTSINVDSSNPSYSSQDGVLFNKDKTEIIQYPAGKGTGSYKIPSTVTSIGGSSFFSCRNLKSITVPDSVTSIGVGAFYGCTRLNSITMSNSVKAIGSYAFYSTYIGYVFYLGTQDEWLEISIGSNNEKLSNAKIYTSSDEISLKLTAINDGKEYEVSGIKTNGLKEVVIPPMYKGLPITSIGDSAFSGCSSITDVFIANSVTNIGDSAFFGCTSIECFDIPDSVTSIGRLAFGNCSSLEMFNVDSSNPNYSSRNWILFNKDETKLIQYPMRKGNSSCEIPSTVTTICESAFNNCSSLYELTIPNSVTSIGDNAFYNCYYLQTVNYSGTEEEWSLISIGLNNEKLTNNIIHTSSGDVFLHFTAINDGKEYAVSDCYNSFSGELVIPSTYNGLPVTSIGESAFNGCYSLTSITIPNSVTSIGDEAFYYCESLASITIPDSVTSIGDKAFYGCKSFTSVVIPNSIEKIGESVFGNCTGLTSVTIPKSVKSIGDYAFSWNVPLKDVYYSGTEDDWFAISLGSGSDNLTNAVVHTSSGDIVFRFTAINDGKEYEFSKCSTFVSGEITIPSTYKGLPVTGIHYDAFKDCNSLTSIIIPDSITNIGSNAFYKCSNLASIYYEGTIEQWINIEFKDYSSNPIYYSKNLYIDNTLVTDLVIPEGVTVIGSYAFAGFKSMKSVTFPSSLKAIGYEAFSGCDGLVKLVIPNGVVEIGVESFAECLNLEEVTISGSVDSIGVSAFFGCEKLSKVTIGSGVTYIGRHAFDRCFELESVNIPNTVTVIGVGAFSECKKLSSISIPDSVRTIEGGAFGECTSLSNISIGKGVINIGNDAFKDAAFLMDERYFDNGAIYVDECLIVAYENGSDSFNVKDGTRVIATGAFSYCDNITKVSFPDSIVGIGWGGIPSNIDIELLDCDNGVYYLGDYLIIADDSKIPAKYVVREGTKVIVAGAFNCCENLTSIVIPDSVENIADLTFYGCDNLSSIEIPSSVKNIGYGAFYYCNELTNVTLNNGLESIDSEAFYACFNLNSITIPESVKEIGIAAFGGCLELSEVTIKGNLTNIKTQTFGECKNLSSISIPSSVNCIEMTAFHESESLKDVYFSGTEAQRNEMVISIGNEPFKNATWHYNYAPGEEPVITEPNKVVEASDKSMNVSIEFPAGTFGENEGNISLDVKNISSSASASRGDFKINNQKLVALYKITPLDTQGNVVQPNGKVTIRIKAPSDFKNGDKVNVYHWPSGKDVEKLDGKVVNDMIEVETDCFSEFGIYREMTIFERIMDFFVTLFRNIFSIFVK